MLACNDSQAAEAHLHAKTLRVGRAGTKNHGMGHPNQSIDKARIGARIRERRKELGIGQADLNRAIHAKAGNTVWRYEHARSAPDAVNLLALAQALRCSAAWLLYGEDAPTKPTQQFPVWDEFKETAAYGRLPDFLVWQIANLPWPSGLEPTLEYLLDVARVDPAAAKKGE